MWVAFREGFRQLGYIEGKNLVFEGRFAQGDLDRLPGLAAELAAIKVEAIVVMGPAPVRAAKAATSEVPIIMVAGSSDPVGEGFIESFARPGGNVTGLTYAVSPERFGKQLELLKQMIPQLSRVAVLWDAGPDLYHKTIAPAVQAPARHLQIDILGPFLVRKLDDFEAAFADMATQQVQGVIVTSTGLTYPNRQRVAEIALAHRLPTMSAFREFSADGMLMSYGPSFPAIYGRAAYFVDKVLKGTPAAEIPVEQPTKHEFVINLKTAKALGLTVPLTLQAQADEVIE